MDDVGLIMVGLMIGMPMGIVIGVYIAIQAKRITFEEQRRPAPKEDRPSATPVPPLGPIAHKVPERQGPKNPPGPPSIANPPKGEAK